MQDFVVRIRGILFNGADDHVWCDEASDVVDVTVSIVAHDPFAQPQDLRHPKIVFQILFDLVSTTAADCGLDSADTVRSSKRSRLH